MSIEQHQVMVFAPVPVQSPVPLRDMLDACRQLLFEYFGRIGVPYDVTVVKDKIVATAMCAEGQVTYVQAALRGCVMHLMRSVNA
jgi:hypothetical protein